MKATRKQIVKAARAAIDQELEYEEVHTELVRKIMKIARKKPEFVLGEWRFKGCGCLIGWLYGDRFDMNTLPRIEFSIGLNFDRELRWALGAEEHATCIVKVVD